MKKSEIVRAGSFSITKADLEFAIFIFDDCEESGCMEDELAGELFSIIQNAQVRVLAKESVSPASWTEMCNRLDLPESDGYIVRRIIEFKGKSSSDSGLVCLDSDYESR